MRYFMTILLDPETDSGQKSVPPAIMEAMDPYITAEIASGRLISTGGLRGSSTGTRVSGHTGSPAATDGPFAEAKEVVGGYAVIEVPDREAAIAMASGFVKLHVDNGMPNIVVEVRPIAGGHNI